MLPPAVIVGAVIVVLAIVGIIYVVMSAPAAPAQSSGTGTGTGTQTQTQTQTQSSALPRAFSVCDDGLAGYALSCPSGKINVTLAKYGRFSDTSCRHPRESANALCGGADVTGTLGAACNGQASCSTTPTMFGDPCPGIFKQLTGSYTCQ